LYSSSSASRRSIARCIKLERPPHQIGVQKSTTSASLILETSSGQSSSEASRKPRPTGSTASERRTTSTFVEARARISSSTRVASSPVLETAGSCLSDALSARTFKDASDGMTHRKQGLVLYTGTSRQFE